MMPLRPLRTIVLAIAALTTALLAPPSRAATAIDSALVNAVTYRIVPEHPCPGDTLYLVADLCAPCGQFVSMGMFEGTMRTEVFTRVGANCPAQPCPVASRGVKLGAYMAGTHTLGLTTIVLSRYPDSTMHATRLYSSITWTVGENCPPPPPAPVLFAARMSLLGPDGCDTCAVQLCPGDSVRMRVQGEFPDGCDPHARFSYPTLNTSEDPYVVMDVTRAAGVCTPAPARLDRILVFPPQPLGFHVARLVVVQTDLSGPAGEPVVHRSVLPRIFTVVDSCAPATDCVWPWLDAARPEGRECAVRIQPGGVATLPLSVRTHARLAGLEGTLTATAPLQIHSLALGANAEGMRLEWTRTNEGIRWVMFSNATRIKPDTDAPILRVGLSLPAGSNAPTHMYVLASVTGASDSIGGKVPICDIQTLVRMAGLPVCLDGGCDLNGDGIANVRDLVRMARCLQPGTFCPDSAALQDCDGNGVFSVNDVICCARHVLRGGAPDSSPSRNAPGLAAWFGAPRTSANGVDLPFSLTGVDDLGSARVLLRYPTDRFEWDAAQFTGDADGWLALAEEITPGVVALGAIQMGNDSRVLPWTLALKLRSGATAGGSITVETGEFSATDGVTLTSPVAGTSSAALGEKPSTRVALGSPRPNPSSGDARFAVELTTESDVLLSVHDISGRTVATLHRGPLAAGARDFVWRGVDDAGRRTPDGVYFVRLRVDGVVKSQRVTVLRGH